MSGKNTRTLAYVTRDDLLQCFSEHSVLMVKGHEKAQRLPVMVNNTIIYGRGLRVSSSDNPIDVLMATDYGHSLVDTGAGDDVKSEGAVAAVGVSKRKSKPLNLLNPFPSTATVPEHFEVDREARDKKEILKRFQEYKNSANMLLNLKRRDPIKDRKLRLRNYYQGRRWIYNLLKSGCCDSIYNQLISIGSFDTFKSGFIELFLKINQILLTFQRKHRL